MITNPSERLTEVREIANPSERLTEDRKFFLYRTTDDIHLHNKCWASAYQLLCKRTTAVVRLTT